MRGNCRKQRPSLWIGADGGHGIGQPAARFFDRTGYARWRCFFLLGIAGKTTYIMTEGRQSNARLLSVTERQPPVARLIAVATFAFMLAELPCATVAPVVVAVAIGESRIVTLCRIAAATSAGAAATRIAIVQTHNRFSFPPPSFWTATKFTDTESACVVPALHQSSTERSRTSSASGRSSMSVQNVPSIKYVCVRQF